MNDFFCPTNIEHLRAGKCRDLNYFLFDDTVLTFACDSSGSVGSLEKDEFRRSPYQAGIFMVKVPLAELIACGAKTVAVYADFCYRDSDYNRDVCRGIKDELCSVGIDPSVIHKAFGTYASPLFSATGLTAVGIIPRGSWRIHTSEPGDLVCAVGLPAEKDYFDRQPTSAVVAKFASLDYVHEILPCGSKGIRYEANTLAKTNGLIFTEWPDTVLSGQAALSCGASAVFLFTLKKDDYCKLKELNLSYAVNVFGELEGEKIDRELSDYGSTCSCRVLKNGDIEVGNGWTIGTSAGLSFARGEQKEDDAGYRPVGRLTMELAASAFSDLERNAFKPFLIVNNLNIGMKNGGLETISALREKMGSYSMVPETQLTGSTEDNHFAGQTGCAVRIFGTKHIGLRV